MKFKLFVVVAVVLLAACSGEDASDDMAQSTANQAATGPDAAGVVNADESLYSLIPGLQFGSSIQVDSGRIYTLESGEVRRGFSLRYLEGNAGGVMQSLQESFIAAGYSPKGAPETDDAGVIKQNFMKENQPSPFVAVYPEPSAPSTTPAYQGKIWISWRLSAPATDSGSGTADISATGK